MNQWVRLGLAVLIVVLLLSGGCASSQWRLRWCVSFSPCWCWWARDSFFTA